MAAQGLYPYFRAMSPVTNPLSHAAVILTHTHTYVHISDTSSVYTHEMNTVQRILSRSEVNTLCCPQLSVSSRFIGLRAEIAGSFLIAKYK